MTINRMIYAGALTAGLVFYFASGTWFSWIVLLLLAVLPLASLLFSLPAMLSVRMSAELPRRVEQGSAAMLHMRLKAIRLLPLPDAQVRLNLRTRDSASDPRYLSRLSRTDGILPLATQNCGFVEPVLEKGWVYDELGLFRLRMKMPRVEPMAILPPPLQPEILPELDRFLNQQLKAKPGGGFAEAHENRSYRPGDPVKDIHWKLSVKTGDLVVREAQEPVRRRLVLALQTPRGPALREKNIGKLRFLTDLLLERGVDHTVVWMEGDRLCSAALTCPEDGPELIARLCLAPEDSLPLPESISVRADWICRVGEEAKAE